MQVKLRLNERLQSGVLQCFQLSDELVKEITHTILHWKTTDAPSSN